MKTFKKFYREVLFWFENSTSRFRPLVYVTVVVSFFTSIFLFLSPYINQDYQKVQMISKATENKPNIILIIVDALSAEDMSLFGYNIETTPKIEQFTQDWTIYSNAHSPSNCSVNIYPALITGRYPGSFCQNSRYGDKIRSSDEWINLFELLDDVGYETWWTGYESPSFYHTGSGIDNIFARPYDEVLQRTSFQVHSIRIKNFPYIPLGFFQMMHAFSGNGPAGEKLEVGKDLIAKQKMTPPFFLYLHYHGVHGIEYPSGDYLGSILPIEEGLIDAQSQDKYYGKYNLTDQNMVDKLRLRYDEAILNQDGRLANLVDEIKSAGYYDSSMIIIMGDHGQSFSNGFSSHCTTLMSYAETHVPLLIKYPFQDSGKVINSVVSTLDLTPTILEIAEIKYEKEWFDGELLPQINYNQNKNRYVFSTRGCGLNYSTVINDQYKLTTREDKIFLFDYVNDPQESNNLYLSMGEYDVIEKDAMEAYREFERKIEGK